MQGETVERERAVRSTGLWLLLALPLLVGSIYTILYVLLTGDRQPFVTLVRYVHARLLQTTLVVDHAPVDAAPHAL